MKRIMALTLIFMMLITTMCLAAVSSSGSKSSPSSSTSKSSSSGSTKSSSSTPSSSQSTTSPSNNGSYKPSAPANSYSDTAPAKQTTPAAQSNTSTPSSGSSFWRNVGLFGGGMLAGSFLSHMFGSSDMGGGTSIFGMLFNVLIIAGVVMGIRYFWQKMRDKNNSR